jgi:energy-coupling factor transporter transmembrane protein EcfT
MEAIQNFLLQIFTFFTTNWIAAAVLAIVVIIAAIKKPSELFKVILLLIVLLGVFYIMTYLEKSTFSGVSSKERAVDIERQAK